jgi:C-terminal processing protease CtpA/Prc
VGEPTNGVLSDELGKSLPGGWEYSLSNEVYFDHLGENHEVTGLPPHVSAPVFDLEEIKRGRDPAIESALQLLMPEDERQ